MIDFHVGITRPELARRAIATVTSSSTCVYQVPGQDSVYAVRKIGYAQGTNPYVSFVDDDDEVTDLQCLVDNAMKYDAFFTNSMCVEVDSTCLGPLFSSAFRWPSMLVEGRAVAHQPYVLKRELAQKALQNAYDRVLHLPEALGACDLAVMYEVHLLGGWTYVPEITYNWYRHDGNTCGKSAAAHNYVSRFYKNFLGVK